MTLINAGHPVIKNNVILKLPGTNASFFQTTVLTSAGVVTISIEVVHPDDGLYGGTDRKLPSWCTNYEATLFEDYFRPEAEDK